MQTHSLRFNPRETADAVCESQFFVLRLFFALENVGELPRLIRFPQFRNLTQVN